jgi:hypothetical protein
VDKNSKVPMAGLRQVIFSLPFRRADVSCTGYVSTGGISEICSDVRIGCTVSRAINVNTRLCRIISAFSFINTCCHRTAVLVNI